MAEDRAPLASATAAMVLDRALYLEQHPGVLGRSSAKSNVGSWSGHESIRITQAGPRGVQSEVVKRCRLFASVNVSVVGGRHIRAFEGSASKLRSEDISFATVVLGSVRVGLGYQAHTTCAHTHTYA